MNTPASPAFDAVKIGLTATPKETNDISNIEYFGNPIYTYSLKQGIDDGFFKCYFGYFPNFFSWTTTLSFNIIANIEFSFEPLQNLLILIK